MLPDAIGISFRSPFIVSIVAHIVNIHHRVPFTWHPCREAEYFVRGQERGRGATETYNAEKLRVVADATRDRPCLRRRSQIHASSILSDYWRDRPRGTSFKPKQIAGSETASRSKEVASWRSSSTPATHRTISVASIEDQLRLGRLHAEKQAGRSSTAMPTTRSAARRSCAPAFKS